MPEPPRPPEGGIPLLITEAPDLLDDLLRLATAADVEATVAHAPPHAVREWSRAPLVLVGSDLAAAMAEMEPQRHPNVVVVDGPEDSPDRTGLWQAAVRIGAHQVLALPGDEHRVVDLLAESAEAPRPAATALGVVGGRGGAGASLLAVALGLAGLRARLRTMLVDADPLGGGLDLLLGCEHEPGARWPDFVSRHGRMSRDALWDALPAVHGGMALLTWGREAAPRVPAAGMRAVLTSAGRSADLLVIDLPRRIDEAAAEALRRVATVLIVVPAEVPAVIAAERVCAPLRENSADVRAVVRSAGAGLAAETVAASLRIPLAGRLPREPGLERVLERGDAPARRPGSPLAAFADELLARLREPGTTAPGRDS